MAAPRLRLPHLVAPGSAGGHSRQLNPVRVADSRSRGGRAPASFAALSRSGVGRRPFAATQPGEGGGLALARWPRPGLICRTLSLCGPPAAIRGNSTPEGGGLAPARWPRHPQLPHFVTTWAAGDHPRQLDQPKSLAREARLPRPTRAPPQFSTPHARRLARPPRLTRRCGTPLGGRGRPCSARGRARGAPRGRASDEPERPARPLRRGRRHPLLRPP